MLAPFAEAVRATTQPCTFLLVVPCIVAVVAARATWEALAAVLSGAIVGGWWFAANRFVLDGWWLRASALVVGLALVAVVAGTVVGDDRSAWRAPRERRARAFGAGALAVAATQWWRPCVGEELGAILNAAPSAPIGQLPAMAAYMLGAMVPVALVVLAIRAIEPSASATGALSIAASAVGLVIAGALVLGRHDDVVVTLTRWTLE